MSLFKIAVLTNDLEDDHTIWFASLDKFHENIKYEVVDVFIPDWQEKLLAGGYQMILAKPPGLKSLWKQVYDERMMMINDLMKIPLYPTLTEIRIYENKRFLADWLTFNQLPHPKTDVFFTKKQALDFLKKRNFPMVAKTNIGASGSGVHIIHDFSEGQSYIEKAFSGSGAPKRYGPKFTWKTIHAKIIKAIKDPELLQKKMKIYKDVYSEKHTGYVLFQSYIPHDFEWRVVCIGDSYFAHKKMKKGEKTSGSLIKGYGEVPLKLLDFCAEIMRKFGFYSQAIDVFESADGTYLINEMQCMFGQSDPHQMIINDIPGRYRKLEGKWQFEPGAFNTNKCFDLRASHIYSLLQGQ